MAKDYGITPAGFSLPALNTLIEETKLSFKSAFGENFNTQSNTAIDKMISIFNERENQIWLLAQAVYSTQTLQGAEGIFLDDMLGKRGLYRRGKTRATGSVEMTVDKTVPYNAVYAQADYTFGGGVFRLVRDTQVVGNIIAQKILNADLALGTYRFNIQNITDSGARQLDLTLTDKTPGSSNLNAFFSSLKAFIVDNTIQSNEDRILIDTVEGAIYIGYDTGKQLVGLSTRIDFRTSPLVGNKTVSMDVVSIDAGQLSRDKGTVIQVAPTPLGFVALTNLRDFNSGRDVESDNEFRVRASNTVLSAMAATRPAILSRLANEVEGIEKVKIFANNTGVTNALGIPPYHFQIVVYGGDTQAISLKIYELIAASNMTFGTTFFDVTTEDDVVERIWHTKAETRRLAFRIRYRGNPLSLLEETDISSVLVNQIASTKIADTLYNIQLVSSVGSIISPGRFTQLFVEVKNLGDPDSAYTTNDIVGDIKDVFSLEAENISFSQII